MRTKRILTKYMPLFSALVLVAIFFLPKIVFGDLGEGSSAIPQIRNPLKVNSIVELLKALVGILVQIGFPLAVLAFIYTGFLFVSAFGNEEKITKAKSALNWTFIGTAILLGAFIIITAIENTVKLLQ